MKASAWLYFHFKLCVSTDTLPREKKRRKERRERSNKPHKRHAQHGIVVILRHGQAGGRVAVTGVEALDVVVARVAVFAVCSLRVRDGYGSGDCEAQAR